VIAAANTSRILGEDMANRVGDQLPPTLLKEIYTYADIDIYIYIWNELATLGFQVYCIYLYEGMIRPTVN